MDKTIGVSASVHSTGASMHFSADGDNVATAVKATEGRVYGIELTNVNAADAFIQLFDAVTTDVTVGTTTPSQSYLVPSGDGTLVGGMDKMFVVPLEFATAITYACTSEIAGATDPTVGLTVNIIYK